VNGAWRHPIHPESPASKSDAAKSPQNTLMVLSYRGAGAGLSAHCKIVRQSFTISAGIRVKTQKNVRCFFGSRIAPSDQR
jgi:hypothetical protein